MGVLLQASGGHAHDRAAVNRRPQAVAVGRVDLGQRTVRTGREQQRALALGQQPDRQERAGQPEQAKPDPVADLKAKLQEAISRENYEEAARLRDEIRRLEGQK